MDAQVLADVPPDAFFAHHEIVIHWNVLSP
jgi:hypothetical protein